MPSIMSLLELQPAQVIEAIVKSGLRGRGGAGYPTGLKWATVAKSVGAHKFVICNGDEGDPGAFMDRSVLESDPHSVIEGMAIAGYAVGADQGFMYVRAEYPLGHQPSTDGHPPGEAARSNRCRHFRVDIQFRMLIFELAPEHSSAARKRRSWLPSKATVANRDPRPPFPAESGLWGAPTLINNVETFANIAPIIKRGPEWYAALRHRKKQRHQGLFPYRQDSEHRTHRSPDGHHHPRNCRRIGRWRSGRSQTESGPDRRPFRRLHSRGTFRHAG